MASSEEDYMTARTKRTKRIQKIVTWVSFISFFGSTAFAGVSTVRNAMNQKTAPQVVSPEDSVKKEEQGYELVLQREPENQVAMEKLALIRIRLKKSQEAIPLLEKLVKLHPEREDYKTVLEDVKKKEGKQENKSDH
jgi:predicted Zn-dependent protease